MAVIKRLPDSEFEIMRVIWESTPPVTTLQIMDKLRACKDWKPQTVLTMLIRLIEKGFLHSDRIGRERNYTPAISQREYLMIETGDFINRYSGNSIGSLIKTLYDGEALSRDDLSELREWLDERK